MEPSEHLKAIWDRIPDTHCKGLCSSSCGPIDASREERRLVRDRGFPLPSHISARLDMAAGKEVEMCPALVDGRCSVYEVRPTICRLWGAGPAMECPWGCSPDEPVSIDESMQILADSLGFPLPPGTPGLILRSQKQDPR